MQSNGGECLNFFDLLKTEEPPTAGEEQTLFNDQFWQSDSADVNEKYNNNNNNSISQIATLPAVGDEPARCCCYKPRKGGWTMHSQLSSAAELETFRKAHGMYKQRQNERLYFMCALKNCPYKMLAIENESQRWNVYERNGKQHNHSTDIIQPIICDRRQNPKKCGQNGKTKMASPRKRVKLSSSSSPKKHQKNLDDQGERQKQHQQSPIVLKLRLSSDGRFQPVGGSSTSKRSLTTTSFGPSATTTFGLPTTSKRSLTTMTFGPSATTTFGPPSTSKRSSATTTFSPPSNMTFSSSSTSNGSSATTAFGSSATSKCSSTTTDSACCTSSTLTMNCGAVKTEQCQSSPAADKFELVNFEQELRQIGSAWNLELKKKNGSHMFVPRVDSKAYKDGILLALTDRGNHIRVDQFLAVRLQRDKIQRWPKELGHAKIMQMISEQCVRMYSTGKSAMENLEKFVSKF